MFFGRVLHLAFGREASLFLAPINFAFNIMIIIGGIKIIKHLIQKDYHSKFEIDGKAVAFGNKRLLVDPQERADRKSLCLRQALIIFAIGLGGSILSGALLSVAIPVEESPRPVKSTFIKSKQLP